MPMNDEVARMRPSGPRSWAMASDGGASSGLGPEMTTGPSVATRCASPVATGTRPSSMAIDSWRRAWWRSRAPKPAAATVVVSPKTRPSRARRVRGRSIAPGA